MGKSGISRSPRGRRGFTQGGFRLIMVAATSFPLPEAALRTRLSVPPLGMPLTAPTSGLGGLRQLTWPRRLHSVGVKRGRQRKLNCPWVGAAAAEAGEARERQGEAEGHAAGSCLSLQAREKLPLRAGSIPLPRPQWAPQGLRVYPKARESQAVCLGSLIVVRAVRGRRAERPELQKREGGENKEEASELLNSPDRAESESCGSRKDESGEKPCELSVTRLFLLCCCDLVSGTL
ncbi:uncharacterized protein LOC134513806 [Chroicocephalus ridibundus]|uniref:uncharacterized protein LOC134513806 n=1 Tax=Chroicocephalus ridibundus TaxID=1192867 RepID=UPI002FDD9CD9